MPSRRLGNIELLRIVSMLMVLLVHVDGASLGLPKPQTAHSAGDIWKLAVESFAIIGVNCFTLISGYFGIRLRLRSVCGYIFQCLFYSVGVYAVYTAFHPASFSWAALGESFLVLSSTDLWYVPAYFVLMLLAPWLNAGCQSMDRKQLLWSVAAFTAVNMWCGWLWGAKFNPTGYTVVQLVDVYLIGRVLAGFLPAGESHSTHTAKHAVMLYLAAYMAIFICALWLPSAKAFAYNSPAVMLASVSFFIIFTSFRLQSRMVNSLAAGAFAVYLIHKNPLIWVHYMRPWVRYGWSHMSLGMFSLYTVLFVLGWYVIGAGIDCIRRFLWGKIENRIKPAEGRAQCA